MPYLWSVPATFEDARAHSPIFIAATLAVASRIAPENNELNARLGRESMDLVLDFLCADVTTLARSGSATPGDLEGCVVLASFYTLARLAIPILQSAKALGLHRAHQDIVENKVERGSVEEGIRVSRVRLYLQCLTFCATFSHAIGVPSPTLETAESIDNLVGILRRNPAPSDDVLETCVRRSESRLTRPGPATSASCCRSSCPRFRRPVAWARRTGRVSAIGSRSGRRGSRRAWRTGSAA